MEERVIKTETSGLLIKGMKPSFNHVVVTPLEVDVIADKNFMSRNLIMKYLDPKVTPMRVVYVGPSVRTCEPEDIVLVNVMRYFRGEGEQAHIDLPAVEIDGIQCLIVSEGDLYGVVDAEILKKEVIGKDSYHPNHVPVAGRETIIVPDKKIIIPDKSIKL